VHRGQLTTAVGEPAAELRGRARDLLEHRRALPGQQENGPAFCFQMEGAPQARARFTAIFGLEPQTPSVLKAGKPSEYLEPRGAVSAAQGDREPAHSVGPDVATGLS
jgi:hypothetical protein